MARLKQVDVSAAHFVSYKLCKYYQREITPDVTMHCSSTKANGGVNMHVKLDE